MVVDDDQDLAEMLSIVLNGAGIDVDLVGRGDEVLEVFRNNPPDLVLLDVMLPGIDGIEVCKLIRAESMVPIIMLTAKGDTHDVVLGLEAGADDYMAKPFRHPSELIARIKTRLRRTNSDIAGLLAISDLSIDVQAHHVLRGNKVISLTRLEFDLLVALAKEPGRVFTRDALLSEVWGYRHSTDTRLVNVHVQRLRSKIEHDPENPEIVITVRGVGYKAGALVHSYNAKGGLSTR
jgi:two-component system response regulator MtrA